MASEKIEIDILVNGEKAERNIKDVGKAQDDLEKKTKNSTRSMKASWVAVAGAIASVGYSVKKVTEAYFVQEKAEQQLNTALKLNAKQGEMSAKQWGEYASALQNVGIVGDEAILPMLAYLKTLGMTDEQTQKIIETSLDLSSAMNISLESAVKNLSKTLNGQKGELGEMIPAVSNLTTEELKLGKGVDVVAKAVKGANAEMAKTDFGKTQQSLNRLGDIFESLGKSAITFADKIGIFSLIETVFSGWEMSINGVGYGFSTLVVKVKEFLKQDTTQAIQEQTEAWNRLQDSITRYKNKSSKTKASVNDDLETITKKIKQSNNEIYKSYVDGWNAIETNTKDVYDRLYDLEKEKIDKQIAEKERLKEEANRQNEEIAKAGERAFDTLNDTIVDFVKTGKFNFKDFANSVIADLLRIQVRQAMVSMVGGTFVGSLFGLHTGGDVYHTGHLPTHHNGSMRTDERIAKLQVGEAVINRTGTAINREAIAQMNRGEKIGGSSNVTSANITFQVNAIDSNSFNNYLVNNRSTIENIINNSINSNGSVRKTIKASV